MNFFTPVMLGLLTFISPCVLPLLPVFVSYFTAGEPGKRRTFINSIGFAIGLIAVLFTIGAVFVLIGFQFKRFLMNYSEIVNIVLGSIIVFLGLCFMGVIKIPFMNGSRSINVKTENMRFFSAVLFGLVYALSLGPCIIAFGSTSIIDAVTKAIGMGDIAYGFMLQLTFAGTLGILFIICAMLIDTLKGVFGFIKRHYKVINIISGCILIVLGILMATGVMTMLSSWMNGMFG